MMNRSQNSLELFGLILVSRIAGLSPVEICQNNSIVDEPAREGFFDSLSKAR